MNNGFKLLLAVVLLASVGLVVGDQLGHRASNSNLTPSIQIDQGTVIGSLTSADNHASEEKVFVGSIKSNKYHYPDCEWAKKIKPSNRIWFSSPADAMAHGYVPCKVCNPP